MLVDEVKYSWYDVPVDVKDLLKTAAENWHNSPLAEKSINQALVNCPENLDVLIAAYRFFFYKNKFKEALIIAEKVVNNIKNQENFPSDWEELKPILLARQNDPQIRLYLNAYGASGFVLARLGELEKAKEVAARVKSVDEKKEFGAGTIFEILTRPPEENED